MALKPKENVEFKTEADIVINRRSISHPNVATCVDYMFDNLENKHFISKNIVKKMFWNVLDLKKEYVEPKRFMEYVLSVISAFNKPLIEKDNCPLTIELSDLILISYMFMKIKDDTSDNLITHNKRTGKYVYDICDHLNFSEHYKEKFYVAASLHDLGKVGIPNNILNKPCELDNQEWIVMKEHPAIGVEYLSELSEAFNINLNGIKESISNHHERYNGLGYPFGKQGDEIPVGARLIAIADIFDSLTSNRIYRKGYSSEEAINMMSYEGSVDPKLFGLSISTLTDTYNLIHKAS